MLAEVVKQAVDVVERTKLLTTIAGKFQSHSTKQCLTEGLRRMSNCKSKLKCPS